MMIQISSRHILRVLKKQIEPFAVNFFVIGREMDYAVWWTNATVERSGRRKVERTQNSEL